MNTIDTTKTELPSERAYQCLRRMAVNGEFKHGRPIPPERKLTETICVSRPTISKAITKLISEGVFCKKEGRKGTFLAKSYSFGEKDLSGRGFTSSGFIKFIIPSDCPPFPMKNGIMEGICSVASRLDVHTAVKYTDFSGDWNRNVISNGHGDCLGLVFWDLKESLKPEDLDFFNNYKTPFVFVDTHPSRDEYNFVVSDNLFGAKIVVDHLLSRGHEKILYLTEKSSLSSMRDRKTGFVMGLLENHLRFTSDNIIEVRPDLFDLRAALDEVFEGNDIPTAIFVSHDKYVMAVFEYLFSRGLKCPDDISVIGYDDIDDSRFMSVPLTTVHQDFFKMGEMAANILFSLSREDESTDVPYHVFLKPRLVERKSVKNITDA